MAATPQGVANRDIKLENTLLDGSPRPLVKICDFGYSKVSSPSCGLRGRPQCLPGIHLSQAVMLKAICRRLVSRGLGGRS